MILISYMVSIVKKFFSGKLSRKEREKYHIEGETSLLRRRQYLEEREKELEKFVQNTEKYLIPPKNI